MIVIKSKRIGVNWRIQMLDSRVRILDFKNQITYEIVFEHENSEINVYRFLTTVRKIKDFILRFDIKKRLMR